jgi:hypothetical protein
MSAERGQHIRPSAAPRWMRCIAAPALSLPFAGGDSSYASDGRLTHRVAELCLRGDITAKEFPETLWFEEEEHTIDEERRERVDAYISKVREEARGCAIIPEYEFEDLPANQKGTGDAIALGSVEGKTVVQVHDLKDGQMPVDVDNNEQLMTYGCGALDLLSELFPELPEPEYVDLWIHMPKRGTAECAQVTPDELRAFAEYAEVRADRAWELALAVDEAVDVLDECRKAYDDSAFWSANRDLDSALAAAAEHCVPGDKQCHFCPANKNAACPAVERECLVAVVDDHIEWDDPALETKVEAALERVVSGCDNAHIAALLPLLTRFEKWIEAVRSRARTELNEGNPIPGYKLVAGRAGKRFFTDAEAVEDELARMRVPKKKRFVTKPVSPSQLEKALPKVFEKLVEKGLVEQQRGAPCVVPESDKRAALTNVALEFENIENGEEES